MTNNELKYYEQLKQKKYRSAENKFLIEGIHLVEECIASRFYKDNLTKVFLRKDFSDSKLLKRIGRENTNVEIIYLDEQKFNKLSETVNSQGIIALVKKSPENVQIDFVKSNNIIIALDNINDPGNLGTILRTCYWFGVSKVLISKNSVDLFNSKVIRSSQGAIFNLIIQDEVDLEKELSAYHRNKFKIFLADINAKITLDDIKIKDEKNLVIVFGNEANGISNDLLNNEYYNKIKINSFSDCESLNVSVAVGIFLYELRNEIVLKQINTHKNN